MRKKTTLALILMMNLACAMAQKSGTTGPLSWNYNETSKELTINRVGGKRSSFSPTFVFRPLTPPYVRFRIRRFLFWVPFDV